LGVLAYQVLASAYKNIPSFIDDKTIQFALDHTNTTQALPLYQRNYREKMRDVRKLVDTKCKYTNKLINFIEKATNPIC
jgi:hypothetical protein